MIDHVNWTFPLPRTHTGMMFGNGTTGLLVWGNGRHLKITIGRADLWDHRGGMPWTEKQNYADIRKCLEANDEKGLRKLFETETEHTAGEPNRPSIIPVGRVDLILGEGAGIKSGSINIKTGSGTVKYIKNGQDLNLKIALSMSEQLFLIEAPEGEDIQVNNEPAWNCIKNDFQEISIPEPGIFSGDVGGWFQALPADPGIGIGYKKAGNSIWFANERAENAASVLDKLSVKLDQSIQEGSMSLYNSINEWWQNYWETIPEVSIPSETLEQMYYYGLYKFAGLTNPSGIAATLQGPWIEEYQLPPWSSDYHFNINVQMCYWPAYKANKLDHLMPLFDMVWSWREQLQQNAKLFIGIDDGYMLPHAVDDRCTCMGGFWTGTIDHACTAWIAQMMFDYCQYSGDSDFLARVAYPFMKGAMRVYEAMLEKNGDHYELPISVSPEYRGAAMNAWGKDASFQLASIHRLCENLITASDLLGVESPVIWSDILADLPKFCTIEENGKELIALWENTNLEESHRHHSHLGAICPFDSIDIYDDKWKQLVSDTITHWIKQGMGLWSGWCVPWASMIHSRLGQGDSAELLLEIWNRVYTNEGYGTLHDCDMPGITVMGAVSFTGEGARPGEVMQMDAGMGAIVAIQDMLMHTRRGIIHIFDGLPSRWQTASFSNMLCDGGFLISAELEERVISSITVKSQLGGIIKLGNPWPGKKVKVSGSKDVQGILIGDVLEIMTNKNEQITLIRCTD